MRFAEPNLLWLLGALPLLIVGLALRFGWRRQALARLGDAALLARRISPLSHGRRLFKTGALVAASALLVLAVARPQAGERTTLAPRVGLDIVVALDLSKSMLARDAFPSRVERAKAELGRLIDGLRGDRLGLVLFAGSTLTYPLTTDYAAAKLFLRDLGPADMPVGGTAIGQAVVAATRLLGAVRGHGPPRAQVIVLLTDGEDHDSDPLAAAREAATRGVRIFAVGLGSRSGEPVPQLDADGRVVGYVEHEGRPVASRLDSATLQQLASLTGGRYLEMEPQHFAVEPVIAALERLNRSAIDARLVRHYDEAYAWFVWPAFLLLLGELCLSERRRVRRGEQGA